MRVSKVNVIEFLDYPSNQIGAEAVRDDVWPLQPAFCSDLDLQAVRATPALAPGRDEAHSNARDSHQRHRQPRKGPCDACVESKC